MQKRRALRFPFCQRVCLEEILLMLPTESILRLKRVQKSWNSLISDHSFTKRHLQASTDNGKTLSFATFLINFHYHEEPGQRVGSDQVIRFVNISTQGDCELGDRSCVVNAPSFPQIVKAKMNLENLGSDAFVSASHCNGIVCLVSCCPLGHGKIVLCNPMTKEFECFSPPGFEPGFAFAGHGFGYDSIGDVYKYVRMSCSLGQVRWGFPSDIKWTYKAHLYTGRTDSFREIKIGIDTNFFALSYKGVYSKDVFYWRSLPVSGTKAIIVALDMSKEEFHRIPLPDYIRDCLIEDSSWRRLALWKESVVLFNVIDDSPHSTVFEMWVMVGKFGGVDGNASWTKHLTIGPLTNIRNALEFWKDDELLLLSRDGGIVSYNLCTAEVRTIPLGFMVSPYKFHAEAYVKSLVCIKRQNVLRGG